MKNRLDLTGKKFGRLTYVRDVGRSPRVVEWLCDCGSTKTATTSAVVHGTVRSCGCLMKDYYASGTVKTHGMAKSPTYKSWASMKNRCTPNARQYARYGGRGISVCEKWADSFEAFYEDMGERPPGTTLDRIDNDRGYEPGNCRWASPTEQQRNRAIAVLVTYKGQTKTLHEWSKIVGISWTVLKYRMYAGWTTEEMLEMPPIPPRLRRSYANPRTAGRSLRDRSA